MTEKKKKNPTKKKAPRKSEQKGGILEKNTSKIAKGVFILNDVYPAHSTKNTLQRVQNTIQGRYSVDDSYNKYSQHVLDEINRVQTAIYATTHKKEDGSWKKFKGREPFYHTEKHICLRKDFVKDINRLLHIVNGQT